MVFPKQPTEPQGRMTDEALVEAFARGDSAAFEILYGRYWRSLLAFLLGQLGELKLAEDVLQEVMLAVWHSAEHYRGDASARTWMYAIARRKALQVRQRNQHTVIHLLTDLIDDNQMPLSETIEHQERRAQIRAALKHLPPQQQEVLELLFYHGLSSSEIAAVTGVALGTVKSRLRRAKTLMMRVLRMQEYSRE